MVDENFIAIINLAHARRFAPRLSMEEAKRRMAIHVLMASEQEFNNLCNVIILGSPQENEG